MAGCGIRSLRWGLEARGASDQPVELWVNDGDQERGPLLSANLEPLQSCAGLALIQSHQAAERLLREALGLRDGDVVEIRSAHAAILGVVASADDVRPGVVSMAHAWGDPSADAKAVRDIGSSTNALVDDETDFDPFVGMARQSAIPVNLARVELP